MNRQRSCFLWLVPILLALLIGCTPPTQGGSGDEESGESAGDPLDSRESTPQDGGPAEGSEGSAAVVDEVNGEETAAKESADESVGEVTLLILDYDGLEELIASHQGSVVVVDVWSTSCGPCLREFPGLVKLDRRYDEADVACISVSLDYTGASNKTPEDYQDRVLGMLERFGATFENVLAAEGTDAMLDKLGVFAPPAAYVYDRQGELVRRFDNQNAEEEFTYDDVSELVAQLIEVNN